MGSKETFFREGLMVVGSNDIFSTVMFYSFSFLPGHCLCSVFFGGGA